MICNKGYFFLPVCYIFSLFCLVLYHLNCLAYMYFVPCSIWNFFLIGTRFNWKKKLKVNGTSFLLNFIIWLFDLNIANWQLFVPDIAIYNGLFWNISHEKGEVFKVIQHWHAFVFTYLYSKSCLFALKGFRQIQYV